MDAPRQATRVRIYIAEADRWHGHLLSGALLDRLRKAGAAGATIFRGFAGFGVHGHVHSATFEISGTNLPLVIEWMDTPDRVESLLPELAEMVTEGYITIEPVTVVKYARRRLRPVPEDRTVADVMTADPVVVRADAPARELVELLIRRKYRALPVVDAAGALVGIVTNGDLVRRGGLGLRTELLQTLEPADLERALRAFEANGHTAADLMTSDVVTVRPETDLRSTVHLMATKRLKRLPVVDARGQVLGIVSRVDILRTVEDAYPPVSAPEPAGEDGPATVPWLVGAAMNRNPPMVRADAALPEVLDAVVSTRLNRAVVVDAQRRPLGVITDAELMRRIDPASRPSLTRVLMGKLHVGQLTPEQRERLRGQTGAHAADLMIAPAATVQEATPVPDAIQRMVGKEYKLLPVVDIDGRLVGIVDRADLLRAVVGE